jgi:hypothetical protein
MSSSERPLLENFLNFCNYDTCVPISMKDIPFPIKHRTKSRQLCNYELKKDKGKASIYALFMEYVYAWRGTYSAVTDPLLVKADGTPVMYFSWTSLNAGSCWSKFHNIYLPNNVFNKKRIDINQRKVKFGVTILTF